MAIATGYKANLETIIAAAKVGRLALMECTRVKDNEQVVVLCAVNPGDGGFAFVPMAEMPAGNPYEMYEPPQMDGDDEPHPDDDRVEFPAGEFPPH